jgi:hypothetical protein
LCFATIHFLTLFSLVLVQPEAKRAERREKFGLGSRVKAGGKTNMEKEHSKARLLTRYGTRARLRHNKKDPPKKRFGEFKNGRKVRPRN